MEYVNSLPQVPASTDAIIDTATQRIVAALYDRRADAVEAVSKLKAQGFADADIDLFAPDDLEQEQVEPTPDGSHVGSITRALSTLGIPNDIASYYETDVRAGKTLVTVIANERAEDALNVVRVDEGEGMDRGTRELLQGAKEDDEPKNVK